MSTSLQNISYNLIDGIYDVLSGNVSYGGAAIPVYKSIPKPAPATYIWVGGVIQTEDGTKDDFVYTGTVQVQVVKEQKASADMKAVQGINGVVRGLLKPSRAGLFSIGTNTLIAFTQESSTEWVEYNDETMVKTKIADIYNFILE